jgi:hypothetical protein
MLRKTFLAMSVAAAAIVTPIASRAETTYIVMTPGDPGVTATADGRLVQPMPAPRDGYRFMPGYWQSQGDHQVWIEGHWVPDSNVYVRRDSEHEEHHWWRRHHHDDDD